LLASPEPLIYRLPFEQLSLVPVAEKNVRLCAFAGALNRRSWRLRHALKVVRRKKLLRTVRHREHWPGRTAQARPLLKKNCH